MCQVFSSNGCRTRSGQPSLGSGAKPHRSDRSAVPPLALGHARLARSRDDELLAATLHSPTAGGVPLIAIARIPHTLLICFKGVPFGQGRFCEHLQHPFRLSFPKSLLRAFAIDPLGPSPQMLRGVTPIQYLGPLRSAPQTEPSLSALRPLHVPCDPDLDSSPSRHLGIQPLCELLRPNLPVFIEGVVLFPTMLAVAVTPPPLDSP
jgi:hypothetical protein